MAVVVAFLAAGLFVWIEDARSAPYSIAILLVLWGILVQLLPKPRLGFPYILVVACLLRGLLCLQEPSLSDDIYRYLWVGKVLLNG